MIASVPRKYLVFLTLVTTVLVLLGVGIVYRSSQAGLLKVAGISFHTEVADTDTTRQQGLSGRDSLQDKEAMLFVFEKADKRCFWMKDMKFSIDIVWLDASKKVVGIKENATPASYPDNFCYDNSQYVVEFIAGTADELNLKTGTQFSW